MYDLEKYQYFSDRNFMEAAASIENAFDDAEIDWFMEAGGGVKSHL